MVSPRSRKQAVKRQRRKDVPKDLRTPRAPCLFFSYIPYCDVLLHEHAALTMLDSNARREFGIVDTWDAYVKHFNEIRNFIYKSTVRMKYNPLKLHDKKIYEHPSEWFEYCAKCGHVDEKTAFIHQTPAVPVRIRWKSVGWRCAKCKGQVWWIKEELYFAPLNRNIP